MAKSEKQKLKLLYLMEKFLKDTDEEHGITVKEMVEYLKQKDISAERKSLYNDVACLQDYGLDIGSEKVGRETYYKLLSREFEMPELKLLVDAVQSSMFITSAKTQELIKKIEGLASKHEAVELQRQVHVHNRVKNPNEKIYLFVDEIHKAIHSMKNVEFVYGELNTKKILVPKHDGKLYTVSPWALTWDDERYYLVGYDHGAGMDKNFRVDKIMKLNIADNSVKYEKCPKDFEIASYNSRVFGMFGGKPEPIKLKVANYLAGVMIDQFGDKINLIPVKGEEAFTVNVDVVISQQFIGWLVGLGTGVEVLESKALRDMVKDSLSAILSKYN